MSEIDLDPGSLEIQDEFLHAAQDKRKVVIDMQARRRIEDRLEQRRLEKLIRDYDFDLDREVD